MLKEEAVARRCSVKKVCSKISQNAQKEQFRTPCFSGLQLYQKRYSGANVFLWIFRFFYETKHLRWLLLQRLSTTKYFKMKCSYITIYMFYLLLSRASVCSCMWGFQKKKKKMEKKYCEINKRCQKSSGFFVQNIFFRQTVFSL